MDITSRLWGAFLQDSRSFFMNVKTKPQAITLHDYIHLYKNFQVNLHLNILESLLIEKTHKER